MSRCSGKWRLGIGHPLDHKRRLADENLEDFPLQIAIAKRHSAEMDFIKDRKLRR
jgi:hypothetical protein